MLTTIQDMCIYCASVKHINTKQALTEVAVFNGLLCPKLPRPHHDVTTPSAVLESDHAVKTLWLSW